MLFYGWSCDSVSCTNGKSRAELPSTYESSCPPLNPMECGNFGGRVPVLNCRKNFEADDLIETLRCWGECFEIFVVERPRGCVVEHFPIWFVQDKIHRFC